ncbi:PIG-L family deacetylase [Microcella sp.]|uniref:PIG-L deacetylase family protein n=1 Tax=Microcella sp. TaxID=1913979 RepID=UPI00299F7010|nr:PIG-L family deacetylase [Microcella sp.]MDX2024758.1 PIG-L family deacetylase [Microcella sp.]
MQMLFVGAHPDDIEIGAAALVQSALAVAEVSVLILTDDPVDAEVRRVEATAAAVALGVDASRVHFAAQRDGELQVNRPTVSRVREILKDHAITPQIVVVTTPHDSHNDHVASAAVMRAAVRHAVFMHYSVHISAEAAFAPRLFVELTPERAAKKAAALGAHASQQHRITKQSLIDVDRAFGARAGFAAAEGFEIDHQVGAPAAAFALARALSESPFHRYWEPQLAGGGLLLLYPAWQKAGAEIDWPSADKNIGRDALREAFRAAWQPRSPLVEKASLEVDADAVLAAGDTVLLVGGPIGNRVVREVYNRLSPVRWIIDYEVPRLAPPFVVDRSTGARVAPSSASARHVVIASLPNPFTPERQLLFVGGTSGVATRRGLEHIAAPAWLLDQCDWPAGEHREVLLEVDDDGKTRVVGEHR